MSKKVFVGKYKSKKKTGEQFILDIIVVPGMDEAGNVKEGISIGRDITRDEIEKRKREINHIKTKAQLLTKMKQAELEAQQLVSEAVERAAELEKSTEDAKKDAEKFKHKAETLTMKVTELSFMVSFKKIVNSEVSRAKRYGHPLSLVVASIDKWEVISKALEHDYRVDRMFQRYRQLLQDVVRVCDYCVRENDNSFVLLLPETPVEGAKRVCEKVKDKVAKHMPKYESNIVTTSFVVSGLSETVESADMYLDGTKSEWLQVRNTGRSMIHVMNWD